MTRDEYRTKCLEAMKAGFFSEYNQPNPPPGVDICLRAAFDALHGIATVESVEPTEEMLTTFDDPFEYLTSRVEAADLTNPLGK